MFEFSSKTKLDKQFKLTDLFRQMNADKVVRKDAAGISKVTLTNVISPKTLNCDADTEIKEIYVFEIAVTSQYVPELFIKSLDSSIKLHTLFNVRFGKLELFMISYKIGNQKGKYYSTNWETEADFLVPLVGSVPEMYKFILSKFLKYPPLENELPSDYIKRYNQLMKLDYQIGKTQAAIEHESQSKRKFEYNARLKEYKEERENLLEED